MKSIDTRVVEARFDNKQFESGVKETLDSLSNLKKGLQLDGATKGLSDVDAAARKLSMAGVSDSVDNLASKFGAMRVAAVAALSAIAVQAAQTGLAFARSITVAPIMDGFREFELKMGSIQTIMAGSGESLDTVNKKLQELNEYSDKTIYSFADMTQNIGKFTNAGVSLDDSVAAIQGVANVAALSGANAGEAARSMYNFAQAISTGSVKLIDWKSIELANMGTVEFKNQLIETGVAMGTLTKKGDEYVTSAGTAFSATKKFNQSLTDEWLSAEVLTDTLQKFSDTTTDIGKRATAAATDVKTFSMMIDTMKESVGSGWAQTFEIVFGNFEEGKRLWTSINDAFGNVVGASADARNELLQGWKDLGGRIALIEGVKNAVRSLISVMKPIKEAFRDIFPAATAQQLYDMTSAFRDFFARFKMGSESAENLRRTFAGLFAVLGIGWEVIKAVGRFLGELFSKLFEGSGAFLEVTGSVGDFLVALHEAIKNGEGLTKFFDGLLDALDRPIEMFKEFMQVLFGLVDFEAPNPEQIIGAFEPLGRLGEFISSVWSNVIGILDNVWDVFQTLAGRMGDFFGRVGAWIEDAVSGLDVDYSDFLATINTGLFGALVVMFKGFMSNMGGGGLGGLLESLTGPFDALTDTLGTMQNTLRATTLLQIAAAVGILAASTVAMSKIDQEGLNRALGGLAALFAQLFAALMAFQFVGGAKGLTATATGLVIFATAIRVLVSSVKELSELSWEDLAQGLAGVAALIGTLIVAVRLMSGYTAGMFTAGAGIVVLAAGIKILASAVGDLSGLSWGDMARGLTGVATLLGALALFTRLSAVNKGGLAQGAGLILLAGGIKILASAAEDFAALSWEGIAKGLASMTAILAAFIAFSHTINPAGLLRAGGALILISGAMKVLASAMGDFGKLEWEEIAKGLVSMAGALVVIVGALNLMPPSTMGSAAALVVVAGALVIIADVMEDMGGLGWDEIARGLTVLAGSLIVIAGAMMLMTGALPGAAALLVVSGALAIFTPVLLALAGMTWDEIARGLGTLAGAFVILGVAGLALTPVIPTLFGLAGSIALLGAGMALAGAGVLAFSVGLTAIAAAGAGAAVAIVGIISALAGMLPMVAKQLGIALVVFAKVIGAAAPAMLEAMSAVLMAVIGAIQERTPAIIDLIGDLAVKLVEKLADVVPQMAEAALDMMIGILRAISENIPTIVNEISNMLIRMLDAMANNIPAIVGVSKKLMVAFLEGLAANLGDVITAGTDVIIALIEGISENMVRIADAGMEAVISFIEGVTASIEENMPQLMTAGKDLAFAIVDGMTGGLASKVGEVAKSARDLAQSALDSAKSLLGVSSPSKEFEKIGEWTAEGFAEGLVGGKEGVISAWDVTASLLQSAMETAGRDIEQLQGKLESLNEAKRKNDEAIKKAKEDDKKKDAESKAQLEELIATRDKNTKAIEETTAALEQAKFEFEATGGALEEMNGKLLDQKAELEDLGAKYDMYSDKLDVANSKLEAAIRTRDDYKRSLQDQYGDLPDISQETGLEEYINQLTYANNDIVKFGDVLQKLRDMGLSDALYEEFLAAGPDILPFLEELLAGGEESVKVVSDMSKKLQKAANRLGHKASKELYQAGVDSAQGLVDGLESKKAAVEKLMGEMAAAIIKVINLQLQIKSPSRVMAKLGAFVVQGLANGMKNSAPIVEKAAGGVGQDAVDAMKKSISQMADVLAVDMDLHPTITPVLDLSAFQKDAGRIASTLSDQHISLDSAYSKAKNVSSGYRANQVDPLVATTAERDISPAVVFNQYNTSPKALSTAEIYRQTKNQLSITKGALITDVAQDA